MSESRPKQTKITLFLKKKPVVTERKEGQLMTIRQLVKYGPHSTTSETTETKIEPTKKKIINVYCDGSTINNGKRYASGGIGVYFGPDHPLNVSEPFTQCIPTNQKAELVALTRAFSLLNNIMAQSPEDSYECHIYTDSEYSINCLTKWIPTWMANNWIKSDGKPVQNVEFLKDLSSAYYRNRQKFKIHHIRAHTHATDIHSIGNQMADQLAVAGSRQHPNFKSKKT